MVSQAVTVSFCDPRLEAQVLHLHDAGARLDGRDEVDQAVQLHVGEGHLDGALDDLRVLHRGVGLGVDRRQLEPVFFAFSSRKLIRRTLDAASWRSRVS